jgi:SAM-dependent methyltransferase
VISTKNKCPVCNSPEILIFLEILQIPIFCNVLWSTRDEAMNAPKADIRLGYCDNCGHLYNFAYDPRKIDYNQNYENSLHYSVRFQDYATSLASRLIETYNLKNKSIIEIGSGSGDFLNLLCEIGRNRGVGFDPSHAALLSDFSEESRVTIIQDFYTEQYASYEADMICCRHVLEHIQFPQEFLSKLRQIIGSRSGTVVFFEVPNAMFTIKDLSIWDLIYEHCSYFSARSLPYLFETCGFEVLEITETFDGQFLCIEASPTKESKNFEPTHRVHEFEIANKVEAFAEEFETKLSWWRNELEKISHSGQRTMVWGAGSKGVTFLNLLKPKIISHIVDINPHKHGKYVPGTAQKIVPPEFLLQDIPDRIILMNEIYRQEIADTLKKMNISAHLLVA